MTQAEFSARVDEKVASVIEYLHTRAKDIPDADLPIVDAYKKRFVQDWANGEVITPTHLHGVILELQLAERQNFSANTSYLFMILARVLPRFIAEMHREGAFNE